MTGVFYWRRERSLSEDQLADLTDVSVWTIQALEKKIKSTTCFSVYCRIAEVLDVSIENLFAEYNYPVEKRRGRERKKLDCNAIAVYCREHNITYQQLADRLGLTSRERARQICRANVVSEKHINRLAKFEGLTAEEFCERYAA